MIISDKPNSIYSKNKVRVKCDECSLEYESRYDQVVVNFNKYGKNQCKFCSRKSTADFLRGKKRSFEIIEKCRKSHLEANKEKFPSFTIACAYCHSEFIVKYRDRDRLYCSRSCQSKSISRTDSRIVSKCLICGEDFKHYSNRIVCSRKCNSIYMSSMRIGDNNPAFKPSKTRKCLNCGVDFEYKSCGLHKEQIRVFCSLYCAHQLSTRGDPLSGLANQYPLGWRQARDLVIKRDNSECQLCECKQKLHVHHIDYDKNNIDLRNLITLCRNCHNATHYGRTFWEIVFNALLSGSKIVKKSWGAEIHIVNHNEYCLKYLIFFKNKQFSYHFHKEKKELWHCVYGSFDCVIGDRDKKIIFSIDSGDKIEINRNLHHQLQAKKNSIVIEVSTKDFKEDSFRLIEGIN